MRPFIIITLSGALVLASCRESNHPLVRASVPANAFRLTTYDVMGNLVDRGWLLINMEDPNNVSGSWGLSTRESGQLRGRVSSGRVVVDLHPDMADNNFILSGVLQGRTYSGEWEKIGLAGVIGSGTFVAMQE